MNTIVGSGTLITFPTLLFFGYTPLVANVSNTVGLVTGGLTGIHGYRAELVGQGPTLRRLVPVSFIGALTGAILLLKLPESAFEAIVPALIAAALLMVLSGPRLPAGAVARRPAHDRPGRPLHQTGGGGVGGVVATPAGPWARWPGVWVVGGRAGRQGQ